MSAEVHPSWAPMSGLGMKCGCGAPATRTWTTPAPRADPYAGQAPNVVWWTIGYCGTHWLIREAHRLLREAEA